MIRDSIWPPFPERAARGKAVTTSSAGSLLKRISNENSGVVSHRITQSYAAAMAQSLQGEEHPPHTPGTTDHSTAQSGYDRRREQVRQAQK